LLRRTLTGTNSALALVLKSQHRNWLLMLQIVCSILLFVWIMGRIDLQPLVSYLASLRWSAVALLAGIGLLDRFLSAWKWHVLLVAKGIRLRLSEVFQIQMTASFFAGFLPTVVGLDAVRIYIAARTTGRTLESAAASTADRLLTIVGTFLIAGVAVLVSPLPTEDTTSGILLLVTFLLASGLLVVAQARWMARLKPMVLCVLGRRLAERCARIYWNLQEFHSRRGAVAACCGITAASFIVRVMFVQVAAAALGIDVSFEALLLRLPLTWVALMLPFSFGGLGLQETAYLFALTSVGVEPAAAVAVSLLDQITVRAVSLLGAVFWLMSRRAVAHDLPHVARSAARQ
jgi:uncharacterized protein (TIRG00374 family)